MTTFKITSLVASVLIIVACHTTKKTETSVTVAPPVSTTPPTPPAGPSPLKKDGAILPGEEQLTAIKTKYPDATLAALTEGHSIYTGVCSNCHKVYNVYTFSEEKWTSIISHMAPKARLTDAQKDVLTKYVFSIKATQPTEK